jgi:hypothetical protein
LLPVLTIKVPVVFMARDVMVLRSATALTGALEGVGPEKRDFLGPEMARAKRVPFGLKKVEIFRAVLHVTGNDKDYLRKIPRVVV